MHTEPPPPNPYQSSELAAAPATDFENTFRISRTGIRLVIALITGLIFAFTAAVLSLLLCTAFGWNFEPNPSDPPKAVMFLIVAFVNGLVAGVCGLLAGIGVGAAVLSGTKQARVLNGLLGLLFTSAIGAILSLWLYGFGTPPGDKEFRVAMIWLSSGCAIGGLLGAPMAAACARLIRRLMFVRE